MVNNVTLAVSYSYRPESKFENYSLTDEEKTTIQDIIAKYDSENVTKESMKAMMDEIKETGIKPSKDLKEILGTAGFEPPEKPQGLPPEKPTSETTEVPDFLLDFISKQKEGTLTESDINSLIQQLEDSGSFSQSNIVDKKI